MKAILLFSAALVSFAFAQATSDIPKGAPSNCPSGSARSYYCKSTPKKGDNQIAADSWHGITICQKRGLEALLIFEVNGVYNDADAQVVQAAGATRYTLMADEGTRFTLSVTGGIRNTKNIPARYTIEFIQAKPPIAASSTYTCER